MKVHKHLLNRRSISRSDESDLFRGCLVGIKDMNGQDLYGGDLILIKELRPAYTVREVDDGWGRTVSLCLHEHIEVPEQRKDIIGEIRYDYELSEFYVVLDDYLIGTGVSEPSMCRVTRKDRYQIYRLVPYDEDIPDVLSSEWHKELER